MLFIDIVHWSARVGSTIL